LEKPVGLDTEKISSKLERVAKRFLSENEINVLDGTQNKSEFTGVRKKVCTNGTAKENELER
jgi:phosphopantetheinyl transferase